MRVRIGIPINGDGDGKKSGDWDQGRSKRGELSYERFRDAMLTCEFELKQEKEKEGNWCCIARAGVASNTERKEVRPRLLLRDCQTPHALLQYIAHVHFAPLHGRGFPLHCLLH
jgi:hypothetical protein